MIRFDIIYEVSDTNNQPPLVNLANKLSEAIKFYQAQAHIKLTSHPITGQFIPRTLGTIRNELKFEVRPDLICLIIITDAPQIPTEAFEHLQNLLSQYPGYVYILESNLSKTTLDVFQRLPDAEIHHLPIQHEGELKQLLKLLMADLSGAITDPQVFHQNKRTAQLSKAADIHDEEPDLPSIGKDELDHIVSQPPEVDPERSLEQGHQSLPKADQQLSQPDDTRPTHSLSRTRREPLPPTGYTHSTTQIRQQAAEKKRSPLNISSEVEKTGKRPEPTSFIQPSKEREQNKAGTLRKVLFNHLPLPEDDPFPYPENTEDALLGAQLGSGNIWVMAGASRRGLSHWHKGTPRDDAFCLGSKGQWNIIALADGAGSAKLSRVSANGSVELAVEIISRYAEPVPQTPADAEARISEALEDAVRQIHERQLEFTTSNQLNKKDTYTTLLLLVHQPFPDQSCVFGTFQVGDGYMMGASAKRVQRIARGDHGAEAGTSLFVLSFTPDELVKRILTHFSSNQVHTFLLTSDGIEDDLKPSESEYQKNISLDTKFETFADRLLSDYLVWPHYEDWGDLLQYVISYEKQGSFDDRTLCVLTLAPESMPYYEM